MRRTFKVAGNTNAGLEVTDQSARLSGDENNFFYADNSGAYIVGSLSLLSQPQDMKIAGLFRFPTAYEMMIPSTVTSPRPMLIPDLPVEGFSNLASAVADFIAELV